MKRIAMRACPFVLAVLPALNGSLFGEEATVPPDAAAPAAAAPKVEAPAPAPPSGPQPIIMNFNNASIESVLSYLSEAAGFVIVRGDIALDGRITVTSRQPLTADEAVSLLNSLLKDKGYATLRAGRVLRVIMLADAKSNSSIPIFSGSDPEEIEASDDVRTQVIPLRFADAVKLKADIAPLLPSYANLSSSTFSNSLILTAPAVDVRRIVGVVRVLDTQLAVVSEVKVFHLAYADATGAANLINSLFKASGPSGPGGGRAGARARFFTNFGGRGGPGGEAPAGADNEPGREPPPVIAVADARTNNVVVSGPPDTLKVAEDIVRQLDADPSAAAMIETFPLRYGQAQSLMPILNSLFNAGQSSARVRGTAPTGTTRTTSPFQQPATGSFGSGSGRSGSSNRSFGR